MDNELFKNQRLLSFLIQRDSFTYLNLTQNLTFSPTGFSLGRSDPTFLKGNTRGFIFLRLFRGLYAWLSRALNSPVNERTILTLGFYVQKFVLLYSKTLNCLLTVFSKQPLIHMSKSNKRSRLRDIWLLLFDMWICGCLEKTVSKQLRVLLYSKTNF